MDSASSFCLETLDTVRSFNCDICCNDFHSKGELEKHRLVHKDDLPFKCEVCFKGFKTNSHLKQHSKKHSEERPFQCQICAKCFPFNGSLKSHMRVHTDERPFQCQVCQRNFKDSQTLKRHMRHHTGEKQFSCHFCPERFFTKLNLNEHLMRHTGELPFVCKVCNKGFTRNTALTMHMRQHTGEKPFMCNLCEQRFTRRHHLLRHARSHHGGTADLSILNNKDKIVTNKLSDLLEDFRPRPKLVKSDQLMRQADGKAVVEELLKDPKSDEEQRAPYLDLEEDSNGIISSDFFSVYENAIKEADISVNMGNLSSDDAIEDTPSLMNTAPAKIDNQRFSNLEDDVKLSKLPEGVDFRCADCSQMFRKQLEYEIHRQLHKEQGPYDCPGCEKVCPLKDNFVAHVKRHTKERPFRCRVCPDAFHREAALREHFVLHGCGDTPYECEVCLKTMTTKHALKMHLRVHLGAKVFECDQCAKAYSRHHDLVRHMATHTKESGCAYDNTDYDMSRTEDFGNERTVENNSLIKRDHMEDEHLRHQVSGGENENVNIDANEMTGITNNLYVIKVEPCELTVAMKLNEDGLNGDQATSQNGVHDTIMTSESFRHTMGIASTTSKRKRVDSMRKGSKTAKNPKSDANLNILEYCDLSVDQDLEDSAKVDLDGEYALILKMDIAEDVDIEDAKLNDQADRRKSFKSHRCSRCTRKFRTAISLQKHEKTHSEGRDAFGGARLPNLYMKTHSGDKLSGDKISKRKMLPLRTTDEERETTSTHLPKTDIFETDAVSSQVDSETSSVYAPDDGHDLDAESQGDLEWVSASHGSADDEKDTSGSKKDHVCSICQRHLSSAWALKSHVRRHIGERPFMCTSCPRSFATQPDLTYHVKTHSVERPFACDTCNKRFKTKTQLKQHQRSHSNDRPFQCEVCSKRFPFNGSLQSHMMVHTGVRPYTCTICNKGFSFSSNLKVHVRQHTGERPFPCESCPERFFTQKGLRRHSIKHSGRKPFICDVCSKGFSEKGCLKAHQRTHTGEKPFKCDKCGQAFTRSHHLRRHDKSYHLNPYESTKK